MMNIEQEIQSTIPLAISKKVILNIAFTRNMLTDGFVELLKPFELSEEQYNVLRILRGQKGNPANMCDIQQRMLTKNSNTTRLIDKLILKECVDRKVCPENRRKIEVTITQKGLELLNELDPLVEKYETNRTKNLSPIELETLNNLLEKLRE